MKTTALVTALLAAAGLASASVCRPGTPGSSSSAAPSASPSSGCTFDPSLNLIGDNADIADAPTQWDIVNSRNVACSTASCIADATDSCLSCLTTPLVIPSIWPAFSYTATTVPGASYSFVFTAANNALVSYQYYFQTDSTSASGNGYVYPPTTAVAFAFTATQTTTRITWSIEVSSAVTWTLYKFALYKTGCPSAGGNPQAD